MIASEKTGTHHFRPRVPPCQRRPGGVSALLPDDSDVAVNASDGTITLTGHVTDWAEHDAVIRAAWAGLGVTAVHDDLVITG
jgi:BON domain